MEKPDQTNPAMTPEQWAATRRASEAPIPTMPPAMPPGIGMMPPLGGMPASVPTNPGIKDWTKEINAAVGAVREQLAELHPHWEIGMWPRVLPPEVTAAVTAEQGEVPEGLHAIQWDARCGLLGDHGYVVGDAWCCIGAPDVAEMVGHISRLLGAKEDAGEAAGIVLPDPVEEEVAPVAPSPRRRRHSEADLSGRSGNLNLRDELEVIEDVCDALSALSIESRRRVLDYVRARMVG